MSNLWDWNYPPTTNDENSRLAADKIVGSAGTLRKLVADTIFKYGPLAEWEIERILGLNGNTVRPRVWELYHKGVIYRIPNKGITPAGRLCWRYLVNPKWEDILDAE